MCRLSSPSGKLSKNEKAVSFASVVDVYEHPIRVGDNPSVRRGVPITIEWHPQRVYQDKLLDSKSRKKSLEELRFQSLERLRLVKSNDHTYREIQAAIMHSNAVKRQRQRSRELSPTAQETYDWIRRKFNKYILLRRSSSSSLYEEYKQQPLVTKEAANKKKSKVTCRRWSLFNNNKNKNKFFHQKQQQQQSGNSEYFSNELDDSGSSTVLISSDEREQCYYIEAYE
jgi:hypothetical protein